MVKSFCHSLSSAEAALRSPLKVVLLVAGLRPLGFLAPRLWSVATTKPGVAVQDVTVGNSNTSCRDGFPSAPGWDPVTGWGRPVWSGLLETMGSDADLPRRG